MSEKEVQEIADKAKLIVNGYAFSEMDDGFVSILNLNHPDCAMVVKHDGEIIETNMDPIEQQIVLTLCRKNLQYHYIEQKFERQPLDRYMRALDNRIMIDDWRDTHA